VSSPPDSSRVALDVALQHHLPYTGLRDFEPDPKLFHYVSITYAVQHRVVPLLVVGDTLKVAASRPDPDLSLLRTRFPYLAVDIVIAPAPEIDRVLEHAQRNS
jgi:hypothetical protein